MLLHYTIIYISLLVIIALRNEFSTAFSIPNSFLKTTDVKYNLVCRPSQGTSQCKYHHQNLYRYIQPHQLQMVEIAEFGDIDEEQPLQASKPKTYGYEGDFQVGDVVKVTKPIRIWSVKQYMKEGFVCEGFVGKVVGLALYGRKFNSLCSAITPVKVEFQPDHDSIPQKMFERKWVAHFAASELELLSSAESLATTA